MKYDKRGVSADKREVHEAIKNLDKGLFPNAFCKILPDLVAGDNEYVNLMHADTAGTKTSIAYLYWRETGDLSVWKGIVQDAVVMNIDDMACAGATDNIIVSSTIGRNKSLIPGEVIKTLIESNQQFSDQMKDLGANVVLSGGETADVGDIVRTIDVGITAFSRIKKDKVIDINIKPGNLIVGLASFGQASYEGSYNSGIGSNGLTFARHEVLHKDYKNQYPESFDPNISDEVVYTGRQKLTDDAAYRDFNVGQLLLSPTRTYLPVIKKILDQGNININGIIHCTGGGQTKVLHFIDKLHVVKDKLFPVPPVFSLIQKQSKSDWREMYQVFNMGHRLEFYVEDEISAKAVMDIAASFNIDAKLVGYCEENDSKKLSIMTSEGDFEF